MIEAPLKLSAGTQWAVVAFYSKLISGLAKSTGLGPDDRLICLAMEWWRHNPELDGLPSATDMANLLDRKTRAVQYRVAKMIKSEHIARRGKGLLYGPKLKVHDIISIAAHIMVERVVPIFDAMTDWERLAYLDKSIYSEDCDIVGAGPVIEGILIDENLQRVFSDLFWSVTRQAEIALSMDAEERTIVLAIEGLRMAPPSTGSLGVTGIHLATQIPLATVSRKVKSLLDKGSVHKTDKGLIGDKVLVRDIYNSIAESFIVMVVPLIPMIYRRMRKA